MKFNTQVCTTREQSERLLALGLKKETADCRWVGLVKDAKGNDIPTKKQAWFTQTREDERAMVCGFMRYDFIPAWSLHRLITMLPKYCKREYYLSIEGNDIHYKLIGRTEYGISHYSFCKKENLYENLIDCIEWLIKENHFNKQYLNESL